MPTYELTATADTVHWGYYDSAQKPVMSVTSGDTLVVHTESAMGPEVLALAGERPSAALRGIVEKLSRGQGAHIMTGPVAVEGAVPGDVLEVRIKEIRPRNDWGYTSFRPMGGGLPEDFPYLRIVVVDVDRERGIGTLFPGVEVPLSPFFGNFGVAPPPRMGKIPSSFPGEWGGNMDNKELVSGATAYFPVFVPGALFSVGDGHGCQGDGEACVTGIEMGMTGTFELILRKDMKLKVPRAETGTHHILMGFDPILDNAVKMALREAISFLGEVKGLSAEDAYMLCSLAVDLRVTQIVNVVKGSHAMVPKPLLA